MGEFEFTGYMRGKPGRDWVEPLQEFDIEHDAKGELLKYFYEFLSFWYQNWFKHFEWIYAADILFGQFRTTLQELTGITPVGPLFKKVLGGFDNMMVKFNRDRGYIVQCPRQIDEMFRQRVV